MVAEEAFSFSCRTRASTSTLVTKILGSLAILTGRHAVERFLVSGVMPNTRSSQIGSTAREARANTKTALESMLLDFVQAVE